MDSLIVLRPSSIELFFQFSSHNLPSYRHWVIPSYIQGSPKSSSILYLGPHDATVLIYAILKVYLWCHYHRNPRR